MRTANAIAEMLKREGVDFVVGYPVNPIFEAAAEADIRTIIVRQERTGIHIADAFARMNSGDRVAVYLTQNGPGSENSFGGLAQAWSESAPMVAIPGGYARAQSERGAQLLRFGQLPAREQVDRAADRRQRPG